MKNKVTQREEFNVKEIQRYNVSVQMNHQQDLERMMSSDVRSPMDFFQYFYLLSDSFPLFTSINIYIYIYIHVCVCVCVCVCMCVPIRKPETIY